MCYCCWSWRQVQKSFWAATCLLMPYMAIESRSTFTHHGDLCWICRALYPVFLLMHLQIHLFAINYNNFLCPKETACRRPWLSRIILVLLVFNLDILVVSRLVKTHKFLPLVSTFPSTTWVCPIRISTTSYLQLLRKYRCTSSWGQSSQQTLAGNTSRFSKQTPFDNLFYAFAAARIRKDPQHFPTRSV